MKGLCCARIPKDIRYNSEQHLKRTEVSTVVWFFKSKWRCQRPSPGAQSELMNFLVLDKRGLLVNDTNTAAKDSLKDNNHSQVFS